VLSKVSMITVVLAFLTTARVRARTENYNTRANFIVGDLHSTRPAKRTWMKVCKVIRSG
jgi:hypothetical protein